MPRTMRTFFNSDSLDSKDFICLDETESHHLNKVLRLKDGEKVEALDGVGNVYDTEIYKLDRNNIELKILNRKFFAPPKPLFRMAIAMPKGNRWEDMIRPLTELGVGRLTPLLTDHSECYTKGKKQEAKSQKWKKIAIDACKQSGNPWLPLFDIPQSFSTFLSNLSEEETVCIASLSSFARPFKECELVQKDIISILIGPEGGWSEEEVKKSKENGVIPFSLGTNTLRLENAAVVGLAVARERFIL